VRGVVYVLFYDRLWVGGNGPASFSQRAIGRMSCVARTHLMRVRRHSLTGYLPDDHVRIPTKDLWSNTYDQMNELRSKLRRTQEERRRTKILH
jgi:hypothetical protein